jgi:two-component system chemotaxis sensor kinase CheA
MPSFKLVDAEKCYLAWDIYVSGVKKKAEIEHAFEWVIGEGDIVFEHWDGKLPQRAARDSQVEEDVLELASPQATIQSLVPSSINPADAQLTTSLAAKKVDNNPKKKVQNLESSSIRVGIDKIDSLINMVGELVITQSMLGQLGNDFNVQNLPRLIEGLNQLEQNTRELQESVMRIRMLPISFAFSRFPRMVRDLGQLLNKKINLVLLGENTELDKTVMEKIGDPLVHLVRNSVDHGIETSSERIAAGKPEEGKVILNAYHQGGNVIIEISDDGRGLDRVKLAEKGVERGLIQEGDVATLNDEQIYDLIFQPGFSTAQQVSDLSGRGVGMDVVKRNIQALNGVVEIQSKKGSGTKIRISLPLTLAILDGQLVRVGEVTYIFPLVSIVESMQYREELISHIAGGCSVFKLREEYVPIVDLGFVFGQKNMSHKQHSLMVVVESDGCKVAMLVDELLAQQQVVIKSLEQNYKRIEGVSGATILGDGTVALIIDVPGVIRLAGAEQLIQQKILRKTA